MDSISGLNGLSPSIMMAFDGNNVATQPLNSIPSKPINDNESSSRSVASGDINKSNQSKSVETDLLRSQGVEKSSKTIDAEIQNVIQQLKMRDAEVKAHEQAHLSAAGQYVVSGAQYVYQSGPDGRKYAIGGEVRIDTSPIRNDPDATIDKALQIRAAALAPAEPSAQDRKVASLANQMISSAQAEILKNKQAEKEGDLLDKQQDNEASVDSLREEDSTNPLLSQAENALFISRQTFEARLLNLEK